ncbi:FHA domain-containing protein [candidate division KSB1 bacterium]|nr:FHA domain-containing protein [candidate division KSB1 bacterium]
MFQAILKSQDLTDSEKIYYLAARTYQIGRAEENDIIISDRCVSTWHAQIRYLDQEFYIRDRGSKNGTLINNEIIDQVKLNHLDSIQLGRKKFVFQSKDLSVTSTQTEEEKLIQRVQKTLSSMTPAYLMQHGFEESLGVIIDLVIEICLCQRGYLVLYSEKGKSEFKLARNFNAESIANKSIEISSTAVKKALETREIVVAENMPLDSNFSAQESVVKLQLMSLVCLPLLSKRQTQIGRYGYISNDHLVLGILYADTWQVNQHLPMRRREILSSFAERIVQTIETILAVL